MQEFRIGSDTVTFWLKVKPRSSRERMTVDASGEPRLEIHAAPTEGQANQACIEFLARALGLPKSVVRIVAGEKSRRKLIQLVVAQPKEIAARLRSLMGEGTGTQTN